MFREELGEPGQVAARREPNPYCPNRPTVIHCHGVNFLSNKEVLSLFEEFGPQNVEWIDDSSCNIVFENSDVPPEVFRQLTEVGPEAFDEYATWTTTRELITGTIKDANAKAKARGRRMQPRRVQLQLRIATEEDRKDPGHSGHTDSVFYAQVKEQQALQKQHQEASRQQKKRQRRSRLPSKGWSSGVFSGAACANDAGAHDVEAARVGDGDTSLGMSAATAENSAAGTMHVDEPAAGSASALRLGCRGLLDPLLFMRATGNKGADASADILNGPGDLRSALERVEAEYASVPLSAHVSSGQATDGPRKRRCGDVQHGKGAQHDQERTQGQNMQRSDGPNPQRGKKRRPVEQEPRAVSNVQAPRRRVQALEEVEAFLKLHRVRCQRFTLFRTFRSIIYRRQKIQNDSTKKVARTTETGGEANLDTNEKEEVSNPSACTKAAIDQLPPWEQYLRLNSHFARHGQFMHTVAWQAGDRRILTVIPHPTRVDMHVLARAVQKPKEAIKQRKLKDITDDTGWPVFVCPPFGHPKDSQGRDPMLLVDSTIMDEKRPLLFDCGSVGLSVSASEFTRSARAVCVEGLGQKPPSSLIASSPFSTATTPEPAPEPAPISARDSEDAITVGVASTPPTILATSGTPAAATADTVPSVIQESQDNAMGY